MTHDTRFNADEHLSSDLHNALIGWIELGIDPDDFLKCGRCHMWMRDCVSCDDVVTDDNEFLRGIRDDECCTCS